MANVDLSLITGAMIGISVAAPFGPASMLCIERTLGGGVYAGLATGLGIATVHVAYGLAAGLGKMGIPELLHGSILFPLISSVMLMAFAIRALRNVAVLETRAVQQTNVKIAYMGALIFGFLNPLTPVLFVALSPRLAAHDTSRSLWIIAGVFLGSLCWWSLLTAGVSCFRQGVTERLINVSNKIAGLVFAGMAVTIVLRATL